MDGTCELAPRGDVRAFRLPHRGDLWISATGFTGTPCWELEVELSPIDIFPPQYSIVAYPTSGVCVQQETRYSAVGRFQHPTTFKSVKVEDDKGVRDVPIEDVPDAIATGTDTDGSVVGWSRAIDLKEAVARAASQLPRRDPNVGIDLKVEEIWYTDGGFVGPMLYVRGRARS